MLQTLAEFAESERSVPRNDTEAADLLARMWKVLARATTVALSKQNHPMQADVERVLTDLACPAGASSATTHTDLQCQVITLSRGTFLVLAWLQDIGSVFLVDCTDQSRSAKAWSLQQFAEVHREGNREIAGWVATGGYGTFSPIWYGWYPIQAAPLPPDASGRQRFYLMAEHSGNGNTTAAQLSIWAWDTTEAALLFAGHYALMIESNPNIVFEDGVLTFDTKEYFRTFFTSEAEVEEQCVWPIRVTPEAVEDLRPRPRVPEIRLIDDLFYRIQRRQPAEDIAAPRVIEYLRGVTPDVRPNLKPGDDYEPVGEMWGWWRRPTERGFRVCLDVDGTGPLVYTIDYTKGHPLITHVRKPTARSVDAAATDEVGGDSYGSPCSGVKPEGGVR